jgi:hypothetical protein
MEIIRRILKKLWRILGLTTLTGSKMKDTLNVNGNMNMKNSMVNSSYQIKITEVKVKNITIK